MYNYLCIYLISFKILSYLFLLEILFSLEMFNHFFLLFKYIDEILNDHYYVNLFTNSQFLKHRPKNFYVGYNINKLVLTLK